ncbi:MAG: hypothetical protein WB763_10155 [Terriglobia bacterium]|jgi:hypothetical protein
MSTWLAVAGMFVLGALAAVYGMLMLISPTKWQNLTDRASLAGTWSSPRRSLKRGESIEIRVAGLLMGAVGVFFVVTVLHGLLTPNARRHKAATPLPNNEAAAQSHSWFGLTVPAVVTLLGLYLLLLPESFLRWSAGRMYPPREIKASALPLLKLFIRAMGAFAILGGASGVYNWLRAVW